jgi:hypothetical protein
VGRVKWSYGNKAEVPVLGLQLTCLFSLIYRFVRVVSTGGFLNKLSSVSVKCPSMPFRAGR